MAVWSGSGTMPTPVELTDEEMDQLRLHGREQATGLWCADFTAERSVWSPEMYALFGESPDHFELTFQNIITRLHPHDTELLSARIERWRADPGPVACSYRVVRPDGRVRVMEIRGWPDHDGRTCVLRGTAQDVTELVLEWRERDRLARQQSMILSASGDGICGLDEQGRVTFSNPALRRLMQREGEDLTGVSLHALLHRDADGAEVHPERDCPFRPAFATATSATDTGFHRRDGSRIEVAYVRVGVSEDGCTGSVVSFRDVTARRAAARLLQTSLQQVQSLSAQRGALLTHLAEAEERERLRIAADIHDDTIQSLGAVALQLAGARRRIAGDEAPEDVLADAEAEVRGVAQRLRALMFELMAPPAGDDLRGAVQSYGEILFRDHPMRFQVVGEVSALAPERHLLAYRLIQEALRNAMTHSRGTRVQVDLQATAAELVIRVADDGVGMNDGPEDGPTPHPPTPPTHGGLRIVRQRTEAAGGIASFGVGLDGHGSAIEVRLPMAWSDMR